MNEDGQTTTIQAEQTTQSPAEETQVQQTDGAMPEKVNALQKFIDGLFGGKDAKDAVQGANEDAATQETGAEDKTFSQADIDAAVEAARQKWADEIAEAERVKKLSPEQRAADEQQKKDSRIAVLENQLLKKELKEAAVKELEKDGYPAGLAETLDYTSKERMEQTLKDTTQIFKDCLAAAVQTRLKGRTPEGLGRAASTDNLLREQIARNIRGL